MGKNIYYTIPRFFEQRMDRHGAVVSLARHETADFIVYKIVRSKFEDEISVYFSDEYLFTEAQLDEMLDVLVPNDFILIARPEAHYTAAAKDAAKQAQIGIGRLAEFMGALNTKDMWTYLSPEEREQLKNGGGHPQR